MAIRKVKQQGDKPRCEKCIHYDRIPDDDLGYCRRYPISAASDEWPTVYPHDWCGEYRPFDAQASQEHLSIPEAGKRYFGLSVNGSYLAAKRGDLPWVQIGRYKRVPVSAMRHLQPREE